MSARAAWLLTAGALAFGAPAAGASDAGPGHPPLLEVVRSLNRIQDRIVAGDREALAMQGKLLARADAMIGAVPPSRVNEENNALALMSYGLSGGNPATLDRQVKAMEQSDHMAVLGRGLVAYMRGLHAEALDDLGPIDPLTLDPELGAPLALLQGSLQTEEEPEKALALFDLARLLAPGTMVEEAALRRSIALHLHLGHADDFQQAARRYAQRFVRSPYSEQFALNFADGAVVLYAQLGTKGVAEVADVMPEDYRRAIYLRIARGAALGGLAELTSFAVEGSTPAQPDGAPAMVSPEQARARLYGALSDITSGDPRAVGAELSAIEPAALPQEDRDLLDAGRVMVDALLKTASTGDAAQDRQSAHAEDAPDSGEVARPGDLVDDVEPVHPQQEPDAAQAHDAHGAPHGEDGAPAEQVGDDFSDLDARMAQWQKTIEQADDILSGRE